MAHGSAGTVYRGGEAQWQDRWHLLWHECEAVTCYVALVGKQRV